MTFCRFVNSNSGDEGLSRRKKNPERTNKKELERRQQKRKLFNVTSFAAATLPTMKRARRNNNIFSFESSSGPRYSRRRFSMFPGFRQTLSVFVGIYFRNFNTRRVLYIFRETKKYRHNTTPETVHKPKRVVTTPYYVSFF